MQTINKTNNEEKIHFFLLLQSLFYYAHAAIKRTFLSKAKLIPTNLLAFKPTMSRQVMLVRWFRVSLVDSKRVELIMSHR